MNPERWDSTLTCPVVNMNHSHTNIFLVWFFFVTMLLSKQRWSTHSTVASSLDDTLQLPPTPPTSNHGDSDGSLPPSSPHLPLPQSSPQPQHRPGGRASSSFSSSAISSSPLLTAPHVSEIKCTHIHWRSFFLFLTALSFLGTWGGI